MSINETNQSILNELYYKYSEDMLKVAYNIIRDPYEAQDIVQTSFVKLYNNINYLRLDNESELKNYVLKVTKNHAINVFNQRKRIIPIEYESMKLIENINKSYIEDSIFFDENFDEIISELNDKYAKVIRLRYLNDYSIHEIAGIMNMTEVNIRVILHRAKKNLKDIL